LSHIHQVPDDQAEGPLKQIYDSAIQRAGGVANIVRIMGLEPEVCRASMGFYLSLMKSKRSLDRPTREMLATVVSNVNDCFY